MAGAPKGRTGQAAAPAEHPRPNGTPFQTVALVLQGGGALGAYQAGVYETLAGAGIEPTWVAGISIGAINSALIAGNPPARRVERLRAFWELASHGSDASWQSLWLDMMSGDMARRWFNHVSASNIMASGVAGFFAPRVPPPFLRAAGEKGATSWYDTAALKPTLERLVDFDLINQKKIRFSVGAVNVRTGNFSYFDNETDTIRAEHIMASGALPPAFEAVEIDGEHYWDGGMVSNTPLDWVLSAQSDLDTLVFQVDLWSARGGLPRDLSQVAVRMKEIQYSSRTRAATDTFRRQQKLRAAFTELYAKLPRELAETPEAKLLAAASDPAVYNIVQLIYRSPTYEGAAKDYEFSRRTMEEHWEAGRRDAEKTLAHPEVLTPPPHAHAVQVFDFTTPKEATPSS